MGRDWEDDDFGLGKRPQSTRWDQDASRTCRPTIHRGRAILVVFLLLVMAMSAVRYYRQGGVASTGAASTRATLPATQTAPATFTSTPQPSPTRSIPASTATPAIAPQATSAINPPTPVAAPLDSEALARQMLALINEDRQAAGLQPLAWDPLAAEAGRLHAQEMVEHNYFSHWNRDGLGPDHRFALAGGSHAVMENLHAFSYTFENGQGAPVEDWGSVIISAQTGLMESPGHRANILMPAHTHVGVGMAYDRDTGQFRLAQEFTNQYVVLSQPLPRQANLGHSVTLQGQIASGAVDNILINLAYEPFPQPLEAEQLAATSVYRSIAESVETWRSPQLLEQTIVLDYEQQPGLYHIRVFADVENEQALLFDHILFVE